MLAKLGQRLYNNSYCIRPPKKLNADDEAMLSSPRNVTEVDHQAPVTEGPLAPATPVGKKRSENNYTIFCLARM